MKKRNLIIIAFTLFVVLTQSCDKNEEVQQPIESINLEEVDLNLNLSSFDNLNKEFSIPNNNIETFVLNNFNELLEMGEDLEIKISLKKDKKTFKINSISNSKNQLINSRGGATMTNCTTCRDENCVADALKEAVGMGDRDVDITVRVKKVLGVQTGLEVCYDTDVN